MDKRAYRKVKQKALPVKAGLVYTNTICLIFKTTAAKS